MNAKVSVKKAVLAKRMHSKITQLEYYETAVQVMVRTTPLFVTIKLRKIPAIFRQFALPGQCAHPDKRHHHKSFGRTAQRKKEEDL